MTRAVNLANLADTSILKLDSVNDRVGIGSTQPTGKLDISGDTNINGGNLFVTNGGLQVSGITTILGSLNASSTLDSVGILTGALATLGGLAVVKSAHIGGNLSVGGTGNTNITGGNLFITNGGLQVSGITTILGSLNANSTLDSPGIHTGALATLGGLAVVKSAHIGNNLFVEGGAQVSGITTILGSLNANSTLDSTGIHTGALATLGGLAVVKSANIGGNLSVGGTITYEDVTNVDSVGIVTARTGIKVLAGGINAVGISTLSGSTFFTGGLAEKYENAGTTLGSQPNNPLSDGNVILFTGNESGNKTINFTGVHATLSNGETVSFTAIITPNNSGVINVVQVDGQAITVKWSGGSAPSAGASGQDIYTFQILKTGTGVSDYTVFGAAANYA